MGESDRTIDSQLATQLINFFSIKKHEAHYSNEPHVSNQVLVNVNLLSQFEPVFR